MPKPSETTRLLLNCVQLQASDRNRAEIEDLIRRPLDWQAFEDAALWHGVAPLAFNGLKHVQDRDRLPSQLLERLKSQYRTTLIRNTIHFTEWERLTAAFEAAGVPVIPLKGAAITRTVYKDIGLRPMSDIDILVRQRDVLRAIRSVEAIGYFQSKPKSADPHPPSGYHAVCFNPDMRVLIEIHWDIASTKNPARVRPGVSALMDSWWLRASNAAGDGQTVLQLDPVDHLCLMAAHFFKHRFLRSHKGFSTRGSLLQLCDILNLVDHCQAVLDWPTLKAESQRIGLCDTLGVALAAAHIVFADSSEVAGQGLFSEIDIDVADKTIARYAAERILGMQDRHAPVPLGLIGKPDDPPIKRIRHFLKAVLPAPAALAAKLKTPVGSSHFYLNYLYRPFGLIHRHGKLMMNREHLKEEGILKRWIDGGQRPPKAGQPDI